MRPFFGEHPANPSSLHQGGLAVRDALDKAREQIAAMINAQSTEEIIFTSGGTESANLAVKGVALASQRRGKHVIISAIEHPAVTRSAEALEKDGFIVTRLGVDREGFVSPADLRAALTGQTILVAVHLANYDVGTIQPVSEISGICGEAGVPLFVDASYSAGWTPIDVQAMGATLLSLAPHRFHGPKGVGVLFKSRRARLQNILHGGVQEGGRRPGTENVPAIVGAGVAAAIAMRERDARCNHVGGLQRRLWGGLQAKVPRLKLNGPPPGPRRIVTNLNVSIEFVEGEGVLLRCDLKGVAFSSGTACVSKAMQASPVLKAIGVDGALALGSILLSPGKDNTEEEIDAAVEIIAQAVADLRGMSPAWDAFKAGKAESAARDA